MFKTEHSSIHRKAFSLVGVQIVVVLCVNYFDIVILITAFLYDTIIVYDHC